MYLTLASEAYKQETINQIRNILRMNSYPTVLVKKLFRKFNIPPQQKPPKQPCIYKSNTYTPNLSEQLQRLLTSTSSNLKVAYNPFLTPGRN